jgi:hypothetical protein
MSKVATFQLKNVVLKNKERTKGESKLPHFKSPMVVINGRNVNEKGNQKVELTSCEY